MGLPSGEKRFRRPNWLVGKRIRFNNSGDYWENRYRGGGNSGAGSYRRLAQFKAEFLNQFVAVNHIASVIEIGCGDETQLALAKYPAYVGIDVSETAVASTKQIPNAYLYSDSDSDKSSFADFSCSAASRVALAVDSRRFLPAKISPIWLQSGRIDR